MELKTLVTTLAKKHENSMFSILEQILSNYYPKESIEKDSEFMLVHGDIPVALVAHIDTVFDAPPYEFFYDAAENVLWSPQGLGADDRAGIAAILALVSSGHRPHLIFTDKEERGGIGAQFLIRKHHKSPFKQLKYIVQLDRRGKEDCVFYDCDNKKFEQYVESFGFKTNIGSFTDISIICPVWGVAGVNLSVGYVGEHAKTEYLNLSHLQKTIERVNSMLSQAKSAKYFKYIKSKFNPYYEYYTKFAQNYDMTYGKSDTDWCCGFCGAPVNYYDTATVVTKDGGIASICYDCFAKMDNLNLCACCYDWFEATGCESVCVNCMEDIRNGKKKDTKRSVQ